MQCDRGSSYLMLTQLSTPIKAWSVFPLSESNDPDSPHYSDISELYSKKIYKPAWFTREDILANLDPINPNPVVLILSNENKPPYTPSIDGQAKGGTGEICSYKFFTIDPNNDKIFYYIDWGDGSNTGWLGPYKSGEQITVNHTWSKKGNYVIKVKAKDMYDAESDWATLEIKMLKNKRLTSHLLIYFLKRITWWFTSLEQKYWHHILCEHLGRTLQIVDDVYSPDLIKQLERKGIFDYGQENFLMATEIIAASILENRFRLGEKYYVKGGRLLNSLLPKDEKKDIGKDINSLNGGLTDSELCNFCLPKNMGSEGFEPSTSASSRRRHNP